MMCQVLKVSRSGFYDWMKDPEGAKSCQDKELEEKIKEIFKKSKETYGTRRIRKSLVILKVKVSRRRVGKIMKRLGIVPKRKRKYQSTTDSKHPFPVHPNLLSRNFNVSEPNRVWVSDITYVPTDEGWLYLAGVMDLFNKGIVGWSMSESLKSKVAVDALDMAIGKRKPSAGLIHHSDRGVQYACGEYQRVLGENGMLPSMSRKGDCWDNAAMESFFSTLKKELIHRRKFRTRDEARREIFEYIEVFYNRQRMHSALGYMSPAEFEAAAQAA
jgi:transposase InsO family protein